MSRSVTSTEQNGSLLLQIGMFEVLGGEPSRSVTGRARLPAQVLQIETKSVHMNITIGAVAGFFALLRNNYARYRRYHRFEPKKHLKEGSSPYVLHAMRNEAA